MKCLVTGGAGFIGSHIVDRLIDEGHKVVIVDNMSTGKNENINPKAEFWKVDIADVDEYWEDILEGVEIVFHTAAAARVQPSIENPAKFHNTNVSGTHNLLNQARKAGVKRFIFSSSSSVYGNVKELPTSENTELNPMSPYALHKLIGEQYCKLFSELYDIETLCLRYSNAYGEGQPTEGAYCNVMGIFEQQKSKGEKLTIVGDGEQRRDFVYVGDIVEANIKAAKYGHPYLEVSGETFNIGYGKNYSVNQIAEWIGGETTNIEPRIEPRKTLLDSSKAKSVLGWEAKTNLKEWII